MSGKAGLKAGLIGAGVAFLLTLTDLLPTLIPILLPTLVPISLLGCVCCALPLLAYIGAGVLGGLFLTPPRDTGAGAGAGAIAGLISGVGTTVAWVINAGIEMAVRGTQSILDPQMLEQLAEQGMSPEAFAVLSGITGLAGLGISGGMCCLFSLALGAGVGALVGLIFAAIKPD
jgi:hypothetical protein